MAIVEGQKIDVKWHGSNRKHYESLGYNYTKVGDVFSVQVTDLPKKSHAKVDTICDYCGNHKPKRYDSISHDTGRTFCNHKCYGKWVEESEEAKLIRENNSTAIKTICSECNKPISVKRSEYGRSNRNFCSRSCVAKYYFRINNPNPKKDKILVKCDQCGNPKYVHESIKEKNKWHFCSRDCYYKFRSENLNGDKIYNYNSFEVDCDQCGEPTTTTPYNLEIRKNIFCSQGCYYKYRSIHYSGENHPHFGTKRTQEQNDRSREATIKRHQNGEFPQTKTSIHTIINTVLEDFGINYRNEYPTKYYSIDIHLVDHNLFIEIMGDYWHANPTKYSTLDETYQTQRKGIKRDKSKLGFMKNHLNTTPLYLWETDINKKLDVCIELIKEFISNEGNLPNYHSYNYSLNNGILRQSSDILSHFEREQIIKQII